MKKYIVLILAAMFLVACGSDDVAEDTEIDKSDEVEDVPAEDVEVAIDEDGMLEETEDPLEAGNKNNGIEVFNDEFINTFLINGWYSNEDTDDDGFNTLDFDGYEVMYSVALLEDTSGEEVVGFFVETENNTDKVVQFNMDLEIETDEEEAGTDSMYGIGDSSPGKKLKGFTKVDLAYDTSKTFEVTFYPPWDDESEFSDEIGEEITKTFELE